MHKKYPPTLRFIESPLCHAVGIPLEEGVRGIFGTATYLSVEY